LQHHGGRLKLAGGFCERAMPAVSVAATVESEALTLRDHDPAAGPEIWGCLFSDSQGLVHAEVVFDCRRVHARFASIRAAATPKGRVVDVGIGGVIESESASSHRLLFEAEHPSCSINLLLSGRPLKKIEELGRFVAAALLKESLQGTEDSP
jgi:hypothetical protein